ncbi:hypothetical protein L6164_013222 [Bauhinia variegata]|uniref:Uncharacterized protein n=1 Tax=Bauhinia variegata TaxID=167791 RepID=A0ACB9PBY2_BAUVA|nr:hypothetical protein L6164_013222 [Bauhinia variegata]
MPRLDLLRQDFEGNTLCYCRGTVQQRRDIRWVPWNPSNAERIMLNVDGCSLGNPGRAGFGCIVTYGDGNWIGGATGFIGVSNNIQAELVAMLQGLKFAWSLGVRWLECQTDCLEALHWTDFGPLKNLKSKEFNDKMEEIKQFNENAWKYLARILPKQWTKAVFHTYLKNWNVTDNMCDQFNSVLVPYRGKLVITMLEEIRNCIAKRRIKCRQKMLKYRGPITLSAQQKLEFAKTHLR